MSDIEKVTDKTILDRIKDIEEAGLLYVKGYSYHEIATLLSSSASVVKENIAEYKKILAKQADDDPYFLERIQFNTIKALQEFDQLSKEAWETVNIATDHGMVPARIQALKLCGELATKKAQLHKLMGSSSSDGDYIARMQKAENVNQILSKILRDVISKHPEIAEEVRKELAVAFDIMGKEEDIEGEEVDDITDADIVNEP
nr:MAG TPA: putative RNA polymerase [Caudoviricetes sp.]